MSWECPRPGRVGEQWLRDGKNHQRRGVRLSHPVILSPIQIKCAGRGRDLGSEVVTNGASHTVCWVRNLRQRLSVSAYHRPPSENEQGTQSCSSEGVLRTLGKHSNARTREVARNFHPNHSTWFFQYAFSLSFTHHILIRLGYNLVICGTLGKNHRHQGVEWGALKAHQESTGHQSEEVLVHGDKLTHAVIPRHASRST